MKPKHSVMIRFKVEADSRKAAETVVLELLRQGLTHAKEAKPEVGEALKYWGLKS